ncbi:competence protein ComEC [Aquabacter spiritensis]|uniref:Competence protein ComEC n=1 Tax=Aquabacter spiritensis TaxID=933073 RepID=A0A4R3LL69_9HYPH|nr:competence protein ComEC [Aquabacter spiritensis]
MQRSGQSRSAGGRAVAGTVSGSAGAAARPRPRGLADRLAAAAARLARDAEAEAASGRLGLWLPVVFAAGILAYFGAAQEPVLVATLALAALLWGGAALARGHRIAFALLAAAAAFASGFAVATVQTARIAHPVIVPPSAAVRLTGYVERVERRPNADRILLRVTAAEGRGLDPVPDLVRLSLRPGTAPPTGTPVAQRARLLPPLGPAAPGAHDFARAPWFEGIGAIGYGLGKPEPAAIATPPPLRVRFAAGIAQVRAALAARIRAAVGGPPGEIAVALVTGDRAGIPSAIEESMRLSGLTHVLSISGLHMAMVAGTLFALVRGLLALAPPLALGFPIKSAAAAAALAGGAFYLLLSGNDVPAQRSFLMTAVVLLGVLVGRPALNLRTVAVAAILVLALAPVSVLEPGTQMSFAATLALVAAYERVQPLRGRAPPDRFAGRILFKCAVFFAGLALTSLVAGLATAPFGALHFQRLAPYGLLANLAAMPVVSLIVMPFGLLGVLLLPFGWDAPAFAAMGAGIEAMVAISDRVAGLPGSNFRTDIVNPACAGAAALALCALCLLRGWLVALALVPAVAALAFAGAPPRADILIASDARTVAVRGSDGFLAVAGAGANRIAVAQWLAREGDARAADAPDLAVGFVCDRLGCAAPLPGGGRLALSRRVEGLEADCLEADIVVTPRPAPLRCPARVFSPDALARSGAVALFRSDGGWRVVPARPEGVARPWMAPRPDRPAEPAGRASDPARDAAQ